MSFMVASPRCTRKVLENPTASIFRDKDLLYVQPRRASPRLHIKPYQKPTHKIQTDTTYGLSYMKYDCDLSPKVRINYGEHEKILRNNTGKLDFHTVYKLSYYPEWKVNVRKPFVPKPCLSINGCHNMMTTQKLSYPNPGCVVTKPFKPYEGTKTKDTIPMESKTIMKESYQHLGTPTVQRPPKRGFWQTKFKADYNTTTRLSYQTLEPISKKSRVIYRPKISASIDKDTVYGTSYQIPGRFIPKNAVSLA